MGVYTNEKLNVFCKIKVWKSLDNNLVVSKHSLIILSCSASSEWGCESHPHMTPCHQSNVCRVTEPKQRPVSLFGCILSDPPSWVSTQTMMRLPTERSGTWQHGARATTSLSMSARLRRRSRISGRWCHAPLHIDRAEVEKVSCFKLLSVFIKDGLSWSRQTDSTFTIFNFLGDSRSLACLQKPSLTYKCTIESILSGCITPWLGSCSAADARDARVVKTAECIIGCQLPAVQSMYHTRCLRKAEKNIEDYSHPGYGLFTLLPSGRRYRNIQAPTTRLKNSFFPTGHQASQPATPISLNILITLNVH